MISDELGDPEVRQLQSPFSIQQNIFRFDVPVQHPFLMGKLQGITDRWHDG